MLGTLSMHVHYVGCNISLTLSLSDPKLSPTVNSVAFNWLLLKHVSEIGVWPAHGTYQDRKELKEELSQHKEAYSHSCVPQTTQVLGDNTYAAHAASEQTPTTQSSYGTLTQLPQWNSSRSGTSPAVEHSNVATT